MDFLENLPNIDGYLFSFHQDRLFSPVLGRSIDQLTLAIPGGGCDWYQKTHGDCCPFCAFPGLTDGITGGKLLEASQFKRMLDQAFDICPNPEIMTVFNGGNFFVNTEVPPEFRRQVYRRASSNPYIQVLMVESKPQYITAEHLEEATEFLGPHTQLMVGIGLESADDSLRNKVLKKGISRKGFEESVALMHQYGVLSHSYVFLKAPGLSEMQAVADTVETCQYLHGLGVKQMALSCAFVQAGTPLEGLYKKYLSTKTEGPDSFRPPRIWTIFQMVELAHKHGWPLSVGGLSDTPPPLAVASNCPDCTVRCLEALESYRASGQYSEITGLTCASCLEQYRASMG